MTSSSGSIDLPVLSEIASAGDLTTLGLAIAARDRTLDGLARTVPELTGSGYDEPHVPVIEGVAAITAQLLYRLDALPSALLAEVLEWLGVTRKAASAASVDLFMDGHSQQDVTLVAGTIFQAGRVPFQLSRTVRIPQGAVAFGPVPATAMVRGPVGNVLPGRTWTPVSPGLIGRVQNPEAAQGGAYAQTREEFVTYAQGVFGAWGTGARAGDLRALASFVPGVERVLALEHTLLTNGARWGAFAWAERPWGGGRVNRAREGVITLVVRAYGGGHLPSEIERRVQETLEPARVAGTKLVITSPEEVTVDIHVVVRADLVTPESIVRASVESAVRALVSGSTWPWGEPITAAAVRAAAQLAAGVRSAVHVGLGVESDATDLFRVGWEEGRVANVTPLFPNVLFRAGAVTVEVL